MKNKISSDPATVGELPEWARDASHSEFTFVPDFKDRIRILFGRNPTFHIRTSTENIIGRAALDHIRTVIPPIFPKKRKPICFVGEYEKGQEDLETIIQ